MFRAHQHNIVEVQDMNFKNQREKMRFLNENFAERDQ